MLAGIIESTLLNSGAEFLTNVFLWALIACFLIAVVMKRSNSAHSFTQYAPTLLTTLGILGTFAGIISGLLGFNVDDIDGSISTLLAGLKTAFTTSLAGMALSVLYKLIVATGWISPKIAEGVDEDEVGVAELYSVMKEQAEGIESLKSAIGGDSEASLVGQMKLLRSDIGDQHKSLVQTVEPLSPTLKSINEHSEKQQAAFIEFQERLWIKLQDFADMMSKSATEQVINALKDVISDFNNNLIEQFGENFKQLNAAVLELVQWQENYKQQLAQMSDQYQQGVQAITHTESAVSHISEESKVIPESMKELQAVMEVNQHQLKELERHLDAFKDIRDRAVEAVPEIRAQIDETVKGMNEVAASINDGMTKTTETLVTGLSDAAEVVSNEVSSSVKSMSEGVLAAAEEASKGITEAGNKMSEAVVDSSGEMQKAIITGSEEFIQNSQRVNESLQGTSGVIADNSEKSKQMFDDALSETNSVLRNLIADLKDDSQKLTESYKTASQSLVSETESIRNSFEQGLSSMRQQLGAELQKMAEQQTQESQRVLAGMSQQADNALKDTGEAVQKQVKMLDDALNHELNRVMNEMGRALTTISGKFTSDYQQLVTEMHKVTRMREVS
ncbi:hypothetical protein [Neptuniibacter halophilus]|uniref:hypothetical protein n=1 Tax=Neptuniibacter halophilus TaxID=651666 RepID=UPI002572397E|nr:hypothetical protein [Neptuniibacter halophilus]